MVYSQQQKSNYMEFCQNLQNTGPSGYARSTEWEALKTSENYWYEKVLIEWIRLYMFFKMFYKFFYHIVQTSSISLR